MIIIAQLVIFHVLLNISEPWVIAVAVVVPVVVIAALVIGGYFFYRHKKG